MLLSGNEIITVTAWLPVIIRRIQMGSEIRDINLAESGERKIEWVKRNCDLLRTLEKEFSETKPFAGKKIAL